MPGQFLYGLPFLLKTHHNRPVIVQVIESLDWMTKKFSTPYIVFYPMLSRDGMPFPINKFLREAQGRNYQETKAWRGNIVVAKYRDLEYSGMANMSMADFPLVKNYLSMHFCSP